MSNQEIAKKLIQHMVEDCTQTENKGNVCSCVANQLSGLFALETIPETKELFFREIEPLGFLRANMGFFCDRRKTGSEGVIISHEKK